PVAHARVRRVDLDLARRAPGVVCALTVDDIPGHRHFGAIVHDEPFLAGDEVCYVGQPIAVIAAEDRASLHRALALAQLDLEPLPAILTIEEALAAGEALGPARTIQRGDPDAALAAAEHRLEGTFWCNGQEHLYLESQVALAVPGEGDELTVHASTQNPAEIQQVVAEALGLGQNEVICVCRRMGGGFGGKETQAAIPAVCAALVAARTRRPARMVYTRDEDARSTGKRHAYRIRWQAGFSSDGTISAVAFDIHSNGGAFADLSSPIMERTLLHSDNAYFFEHFRATGTPCRTHLPPNTAFRGFGGPQGMANVEDMIERVATHLGLDPLDVRRRNLYGRGERDTTPYGQVVANHILPELVDRLAPAYAERRAALRARRDPTCARGLALTPIKFGISFTNAILNQGNALVHVYKDGTVQVSTGGTEMGQGLFTKVRQLVADALGVPWETVRVMPTSTDKTINSPPTAASAGTDLNGMAALDACRQIRANLAGAAATRFADPAAGRPASPEHVQFEDGVVWDSRAPEATRTPFADVCLAAWLSRVSLGARGFYRTPGVDYNRETGRGTPFFYFTTGAALVEVCVDRFTGQVRVERADLVMDIGESINPGVDRGQAIGGFVQGMGWVTTEALVYADDGRLLALSPTTYKIPGVRDVPAISLEFVPNPGHVINVRRSKAIGEPPFMLAIAVWCAIRDAIGAIAPGSQPDLRLPATAEEVLRCLTEAEEGASFPAYSAEIPIVGRAAGGRAGA
ncbi:MAG TPA: xanthine dehydrogenase molybdopterin binding subunit, partial [Myxococcota bacterium]|nr:xanthine dehydrogenase molybdopterin binding subunit [Myxococcota bacterium]